MIMNIGDRIDFQLLIESHHNVARHAVDGKLEKATRVKVY